VQHKAGRVALFADFKRHLRVDDLQKVVLLALGKQLEFWLARGLHEQAITVARDGDDERGRHRVLTHVAIEHFRIDGDLCVQCRRWEHRELRVST
jgi:hypothetical protein